MKIKTSKAIITDLLTKHPHLRDSDNQLIATIWKHELIKSNKVDYESCTADTFLKMYANKTLMSAESIRRCRCKIQEESEHLRGEQYEARQIHTYAVKQELKDWKEIKQSICECTHPYFYDGLCGECGKPLK